MSSSISAFLQSFLFLFLIWNLDTLAAVKNNFNDGFGIVALSFSLAKTCNYNGEEVTVKINAETFCGKPIEVILKKAAAVFGGGRDSSRKITLTIADFSACDTVTTVTVVIVNKDTAATGGNEFFNFSLAGGTFFNDNVTGIKNFTSGTSPLSAGSVLTWALPASIAPGDSVVFRFEIFTDTCA